MPDEVVSKWGVKHALLMQVLPYLSLERYLVQLENRNMICLAPSMFPPLGSFILI